MARRSLPPLCLAAPFAAFLTELARERAVYIVGGWLRDALRGAPAQDADFATDAGADTVRRLADKHRLKIFADKVAEQHGTYRMTSGRPHEVLDVATLRADVARLGARHAAVAFTDDITLDLARRDLTINGMAAIYPFVTPTLAHVIDPFGGQRDVARRTLRLIGDPVRRLEEDPLRLLRVARFASLGPGWTLESHTRAALKKRASWLTRISKERLRDEVKKSLTLPTPARFWQILRHARALAHVWPMPSSFRLQDGIRALAHVRIGREEPLARLCAFVVAGCRPARSTGLYNESAAQETLAAAAAGCWARLKAPGAEVALVEAVARAFPWQPHALHGETLVAWLLRHQEAVVSLCRRLSPTLIRARLAPKSPLDALWRRVAAMLEGAPVPTLNELAIDGRTLEREGLVEQGPEMGALLRRLLHVGVLTASTRDPAAMLAHAKRLVRESEP